MKLTPEQLGEIRGFLFETPHYRETYYELYDHVVNALQESGEPFDIDLVSQIVKEDFGGFEGIINQEKAYQKCVTSKYNRLLRSEMLKSFQTSTVLSHLAIIFIGYIFYNASLSSEINLGPTTVSMLILSNIPGVYYVFKRFVLDRNKHKLSIKYDFLHRCWILGFLGVNFILGLLVSKHSLVELSNPHKVIVLMAVFFFINLHVRSFIKVYNKRINILVV